MLERRATCINDAVVCLCVCWHGALATEDTRRKGKQIGCTAKRPVCIVLLCLMQRWHGICISTVRRRPIAALLCDMATPGICGPASIRALVQHKRDRKSGTFTQWNSAALLAKPQHGSLIAEEQREGKKRGDKNKVHIIRPEPCIASSGTTRSRPSQAPSRRSIMETSGCGNGHDGYGTTR